MGNSISSLILLATIMWAYLLMSANKSKIAAGQISDAPLTGGKKAQVWVLAILNPLFTDLIFYFG
jgi:hypothetical protein